MIPRVEKTTRNPQLVDPVEFGSRSWLAISRQSLSHRRPRDLPTQHHARLEAYCTHYSELTELRSQGFSGVSLHYCTIDPSEPSLLDLIGNLHTRPCINSIVLIAECDHCPHNDGRLRVTGCLEHSAMTTSDRNALLLHLYLEAPSRL